MVRFHTQPVENSPDATPEKRQPKAYGAARHHTQPVTPDEKKAAEETTIPKATVGVSLAER